MGAWQESAFQTAMRVCSVASVVSNSGDPMTVACRSPLSVGIL